MSEELWVVRAGEGARYVGEFESGAFIAVGFEELAPDDLSATDEDALRARVTSAAQRTYAGQLIAFAYRMDVGDLVVVPRLVGKHRDYLVGRVTGPYRYVADPPASGHHQRPVEWLGTFARDALSQSAVNTLGAILTMFRPTTVEAELRGLLTSLAPLQQDTASRSRDAAPAQKRVQDADAPLVGLVPPPRRLQQAQLDVALDGRGRARMTCGHPALIMEQTARHLDPAPDWAGVPGIYVLTGTDTKQSSSRTGNERT